MYKFDFSNGEWKHFEKPAKKAEFDFPKWIKKEKKQNHKKADIEQKSKEYLEFAEKLASEIKPRKYIKFSPKVEELMFFYVVNKFD